jgi:hypothetical protein
MVAAGLEAEQGRADIATDLQRAAEQALVTRPAFYWEVVAGAFVANGSSLAQVSAFAEAGIQRYAFTAVLDEVTTGTCRFLDGKTFSVGDALGRFDRIERLDSRTSRPSSRGSVRRSMQRPAARCCIYVDRGGVRTPIAE